MDARRQVGVAALIAVLITVVFFFLLLRPKLNTIAETREQVETAQDEELQLQADVARLRNIQRNAPDLRRDLARVATLLPESPQLPAFIRLLQDAANREGMELLSIAPSPPGAGTIEGVQVITVSVSVEGSFHRTEAFLASLEGLKRLVEVTSISMSPRIDTQPFTVTISSTMSMRMYVVSAGESS